MNKQNDTTDAELIDRIAYKLFKAYGAGTRALKFNDFEEAKEIIALVRQHDKDKWMSVDTNPDETGEVLVWDSVVGVRVVFYHKIGVFHPTKYSQEFCRDLTHWQPLPAPPQEKQE